MSRGNRDKRQQQEPRGRGKHPPSAPQVQRPSPVPLCAYCQERPGVTVEHVVARCFFGSVPPKRAIKVPACRECNEGRGDGGQRPLTMDEEYVRTVLALEHRSSDHRVAANLLTNEIPRSYDNSPGLLRRIAHRMSVVDATARGGIIVPSVPLITVETDRLIRVLKKIARGLFYAVNERPLPQDCPVTCSPRLDAEKLAEISRRMDGLKRTTRWWNIGEEGGFRFRCAMEHEHSTRSLWLLIFYDSVAFGVHTVPPKTP